MSTSVIKLTLNNGGYYLGLSSKLTKCTVWFLHCAEYTAYRPISFSDCSQIRANAVQGISFSALIRSYCKVAYYSGLSSASPGL